MSSHVERVTTATNSSLVLFVTPVVALVLGWLVLQEVVEPVIALGTFLILSGVYLTVKQGKVPLWPLPHEGHVRIQAETHPQDKVLLRVMERAGEDLPKWYS